MMAHRLQQPISASSAAMYDRLINCKIAGDQNLRACSLLIAAASNRCQAQNLLFGRPY